EHEEAAQPVDRAEEHEEVPRLEPRRAVAEGDRRDRQRQPAEPQHEEELLDELGPVRIRRTQGGDEGLARQDHHVADLLQQVLGRQEDPICGGPYHLTNKPPPSQGGGQTPARNSTPWPKPMASPGGWPDTTAPLI